MEERPRGRGSVVEMEPVVVTATATLASPPADVWPLITNTDRTNRLLVGPVTFRPIEDEAKTAARFVAVTSSAGLSLEYEEAPFEWSVNEAFSVYRRMRSGPLRSYTWSLKLTPEPDGGTRVDVRLEIVPRHWLVRPIAQLQGRRVLAAFVRLTAGIDAHLRDKAPSPYAKPASPASEDKLLHATRELAKRGIEPSTTRALVDLIRTGPDADVVRIRPFEVAEQVGVDGREMLRACLHAVTLGIVELRWALVCPSCRTAADHVESLSALTDAGHCQLCDITYGVELDRAVEATFRPHPSTREVHDQLFCIGGPFRTPHVLAQVNLEERGSRRMRAPGSLGRYRLFARGGAIASVEVTKDGASAAATSVGEGGFQPAELTVGAGGSIEVTNATSEARHVKLEELGYATRAATAHVVTTMSEFRRLFSKELLKPSTPLKVASSAILFSDLTGSTALYATAGDAAAFRLVDDHFDLLRRVVAESGGTVVKTMGDAVMAAFLDAESCVRAALSCLREFETFRHGHDHGELTGLKLGLYAGPCYVVTANETIDYFGQTVNCASRVQHLAESGELVVAESVYDALPSSIRDDLRLVERFDARLKGVDGPLRLARVTLAEVGEACRGASESGAAGLPAEANGR